MGPKRRAGNPGNVSEPHDAGRLVRSGGMGLSFLCLATTPNCHPVAFHSQRTSVGLRVPGGGMQDTWARKRAYLEHM